MIAHNLGLGFAIAVELFWVYQIYTEIKKPGTWYNELKMDENKDYNFKNKLILSFRNRLRLSIVFGVAVLAPIATYVLVKTMVLGIKA